MASDHQTLEQRSGVVDITLIVCTYNRCSSLAKTLEIIAASKVPNSIAWEILVVDNNSTDETRSVVAYLGRRFPGRFRYVFEGQQGLSCARNRGIRESTGEILVFTDDDVTAEPDWLWNLTSELRGGEWAGAGGQITPLWSGPPPKWVLTTDTNITGPYAVFNMGPEPVELKRPPYGANMAFRREMFARYGDFRVDLGRSGTNLQGREEVEFANRLLAAGERLRYEPRAVIYHTIPRCRMCKRYVLKWWYWYGRSEIAESGPPKSRWVVCGIPLAFLRRVLRWAAQSVFSTDRQRLSCQIFVFYIAGMAVACYELSRSGNVRMASLSGVAGTHIKGAPE
ncbi:MAG TPA: glycosyltransferase [Terriglobales bacterium]|nr:glycosyltransferase [Terriglobales bacterium]